MRREVEDFIRDDESYRPDDPDVVCSCAHCGKDIRIGQDMMVLLNVNGKTARLCENCIEWIDADTLAEMLGIWSYSGDASSAEAALNSASVAMERRRQSE